MKHPKPTHDWWPKPEQTLSQVSDPDVERHAIALAWSQWDVMDTQDKEKLRTQARIDIMARETEARARSLAYQEGWEYHEWDDGDLLSPSTHARYRDQARIAVERLWEEKLNA